ncbi:MAG: M20/M25/M40 family metallo-hydrolase [Sphingomonadales bacterium]|nr:M20/M25/M40 family metallo-hydrolase [Sphingomonadales bacterium]MDE2168241.1 M20/M25/M40 family metallo-hydrolase [Sphingomonadales bacterium]
MKRHLLLAAALTALTFPAFSLAAPAATSEDADVARIIDEGMNHSQAMLTASALMDRIGPRLTNSDAHRRAQQWAMDVLRSYGLQNVHQEAFDFGLGWNLASYSASMTAPRPIQLTVIPVAWSPPTSGTLHGGIVVAPITKESQFAQWKGKLAGKIVLISMPGETAEPKDSFFKRLSEADVNALDTYNIPEFDPEKARPNPDSPRFFQRKLSEFLKAEGAIAMVKMAYRDGKLVSGEGYDYQPGKTLALPTMEMAQEDYRRLVRLSVTGANPEMDMAINASFDDKNLKASNVIAEIPGSDPKAGYVMAGGHFDSWIAADGATDNGAGSITVMEAARLIMKLGIKPKRTIRFALWGGEEQGLLGSRAYIEQHFVSRPMPAGTDPFEAYTQWRNAWPITVKPEYKELKAYFNMDNGSGRFHGLYAEGNVGVTTLLSQWLAPFKAMGAGHVVARKTGGTDHVFMQAVGLPGYQFIQDPLDYGSRVHHSSLDTLDHMRGDDMRQASVVMAGMLWEAANSDKELPRQPLPTKPDATDPFKVAEPTAH